MDWQSVKVSILDYNKFPIKEFGRTSLKGTKCWIEDNKKKIGFNKKGELVVKGKNVMMGYHKDKLTNEKFLKINKDLSILFWDILKLTKMASYIFSKEKTIFLKVKITGLAKFNWKRT